MTQQQRQLARIRKAAAKVAAATAARDAEVTAAVQAGLPLRAIGEAAGVSHEQARVIAQRAA